MRAQEGHRGRTRGAHQTVTDARVSSTVEGRIRHVIDRGEWRAVRNGKEEEKGGGKERERKNSSPRRTVITHSQKTGPRIT